MDERTARSLEEAINTAKDVLDSLVKQIPLIESASKKIADALRSGNKVVCCGNGGSGCHANHLVSELVGHYRRHRSALPAISLSPDGTLLSCLGNDFSFEYIFSRQIEALGYPNDVLICFSTSGNSRNIIRAIETGRSRQLVTIALLGGTGGQAKGLSDIEVIVSHSETARVQEAHHFLVHGIMDAIENSM